MREPWPPAGSEMAEVIRQTSWEETPLGPTDDWPPGLRTAVTMALDSPVPSIVLWGPALIQIYNDAYRHVLAGRHPAAMGQPTRECWPEVWDFNEPIYRSVLGSGTSVHLEDQAYEIEPSGIRESRYFTISYAPARDEFGAVHGVFVVAVETTRRVLVERENDKLLSESTSVAHQLREMFDQSPSFIALLDGPAHVFSLANEAYHRLSGWTDLIGKSVAEAIPEAQTQGFVALLDDAFATGEPFVASAMPMFLPMTAEGAPTQRYFDFVYQPIRDAGGRVRQIFIGGYDVTEHQLEHLALARVNDELGDKIRCLEEAERRQKFLLDLSDRFRCTLLPQDLAFAACELLGEFLSVDRVIFCEVDDPAGTFFVRCEWMRGSLPTLTGVLRKLDDFGPPIVDALRAGHVFVCDNTATDVRTAEHAGAYADLNLLASLAVPLVQGGEMKIILNVQSAEPHHWTREEIAVARDMAERTWAAAESLRAQAELRLERDLSRYVFENMTEGFGMIDEDWNVVQMNAEGLRLGQRSASEVIGRNHWEVWPEVLGTEVEAVYRRVRETGKAESFEQHVPLSPGIKIWLEVRAQRARNGELAVFYHDISVRKEAELRLQDAAVQKDIFLAMLGHELRNPLAPICASAELLVNMDSAEPRVRQLGQVILRNATHMTSLMQDLLDVSRVTQGFVDLASGPVDVKSVVNEAIEQVQPLLEARRHQLSVSLASEPAWVTGDRKRLVQVVANLLGNAAKFTDVGGRIEVVLSVTASQVTISIADNGIGMTPELSARAFDLFYQANRSSDRAQGGLGVGLALVKGLVALHHGTARAESDGPGTGSRFTASLPRVAAPPERSSAVGITAVVQAEPLQVLIVDDNADAATMLGLVLSAKGHIIRIENSPQAALQPSHHTRPDVCLLDLGLPDMDGHELMRRLAALPGMAETTFIAVTGYGQPHDKERAIAAGFADHFVKPANIPRLLALLAGVRRAV